MIDRRTFVSRIASAVLASPLALLAQQTRIARIGYLRRTSREPADIEALSLGLRELGYIEGQNLAIDERYANGDAARLPDLARELMQLKVRVLVVDGAATVHALREVVGTTPLVFTLMGDPVGGGFVRSLDHPGGNMTGLTSFSGELLLKRLQLLHDVVPAKRVGFLFNPTSFNPARTAEHLTRAARSLGINMTLVDAPTLGDLAGAFAKMSQAGVAAAVVDADAMFFSQRVRIVDLAAKHRLPAVYAEREFADVGGPMAYAPNVSVNFHRAATYVDKILKGRKTRRPPDRAADDVRAGDQRQDREGARALDPAVAAAARRGDRMIAMRTFVIARARQRDSIGSLADHPFPLSVTTT